MHIAWHCRACVTRGALHVLLMPPAQPSSSRPHAANGGLGRNAASYGNVGDAAAGAQQGGSPSKVAAQPMAPLNVVDYAVRRDGLGHVGGARVAGARGGGGWRDLAAAGLVDGAWDGGKGWPRWGWGPTQRGVVGGGFNRAGFSLPTPRIRCCLRVSTRVCVWGGSLGVHAALAHGRAAACMHACLPVACGMHARLQQAQAP